MSARSAAALGAIILICAAGAVALARSPKIELASRFLLLNSTRDTNSLYGRILGAELAREMFTEHILFGAGAGGFRHLEPKYNERFPLLTQDVGLWYEERPKVVRTVLQDAHNDHLQILAELGLVGGAIVYGLTALGLASLSVRRRHPLPAVVLVAFVVLLLFAAVDFPFLNPAVLSALVLATTGACRWTDLEHRPSPEQTSGHSCSPPAAISRAEYRGSPDYS